MHSPAPQADPVTGPGMAAMADAGWWQRGLRNGTAIGGLLVLAAVLLNGTDIAATGAALRDLPTAILISAVRPPAADRDDRAGLAGAGARPVCAPPPAA